MKRKWFIKLMLLAAVTLMSAAGYSQRQQDSLYNYLTLAAKNNPGVLQSFYEYKAALQKVPQAGGLPDPELQLGVFVQPMELVMGKEVADLRLMQMFPWFGTLKAGKDEMSLMAMAKFESFREAELRVFFNVKQSFYDLQRLKNEILYSEKNLEILHTIERLTTVRYKTATAGASNAPPMSATGQQNASNGQAGMGGMGGSAYTGSMTGQGTTTSMTSGSMGSSAGGIGLADLYRIRIEIADLENGIALLQNQMTTAVARFNNLLNRPSSMPVSLPDSLVPDSLGISLDLVSDSILAHNPMLGMISYESQSLDARKKMVTRMGYPMIGLGVDYSVISKSDMSTSSMNGQDMFMPMITMTLPVYRGKYNAMKKEAELLKTASGNNYQSAVNSLQTEFYEASQLLKDSERRMGLYDNQADLSQRTLEIMLSGFSTAGTSLTDILRVRQQTLDYRFKKIEAIADYNTAISWLQQLMASQTNTEN